MKQALVAVMLFVFVITAMAAVVVGGFAKPPSVLDVTFSEPPHPTRNSSAWNTTGGSHSHQNVTAQTHLRLGCRHHSSSSVRVLQLEKDSETIPSTTVVVPQSTTMTQEESIRPPMKYNPSVTQNNKDDSDVTRMTTTKLLSILLVATSGTIVFCTMLLHVQHCYNTFLRWVQEGRKFVANHGPCQGLNI